MLMSSASMLRRWRAVVAIVVGAGVVGVSGAASGKLEEGAAEEDGENRGPEEGKGNDEGGISKRCWERAPLEGENDRRWPRAWPRLVGDREILWLRGWLNLVGESESRWLDDSWLRFAGDDEKRWLDR